jgi:hypothetical protein
MPRLGRRPAPEKIEEILGVSAASDDAGSGHRGLSREVTCGEHRHRERDTRTKEENRNCEFRDSASLHFRSVVRISAPQF